MAISKTQPMRSAEIEAINLLNGIDASIGVLGDDLELEEQARIEGDLTIKATIGTEFTPQNTISNSLSATNRQVSLLAQEVDSNTAAIESLQGFDARIKIGKIPDLVIPASDSMSTSYVFPEPFPETAACILIAQVITDELSTLFDFTLIDCTYSGFSYSISNSDADTHTVSLGFMAVNVNTL